MVTLYLEQGGRGAEGTVRAQNIGERQLLNEKAASDQEKNPEEVPGVQARKHRWGDSKQVGRKKTPVVWKLSTSQGSSKSDSTHTWLM